MRTFKILLFSSIISTYSVASYALFCPTNFNEVNLGDSVEQVKQQCGNPDAEKDSTYSPNVPQEWTYYQKFNYTDQGSFKMTVSFVNNKVINISVNGVGIGSTTLCKSVVNLGDTQQAVKNACGSPVLVNMSQEVPTDRKIKQLIYNSSPNVTFIFIDGKLKERR